MPQDIEDQSNGLEIASKRTCYGPNAHLTAPVQMSDPGQDSISANGMPPNVSHLDGDLTPVEQMIAMIGALLAEGERGAESLEILISKLHPDLLADIVITNMKHLPKSPPPLTRLGSSMPPARLVCSLSGPAQLVAPSPTNSVQSPVLPAKLPLSSSTAVSASLSDMPAVSSFATDSKRDPRRVITFQSVYC